MSDDSGRTSDERYRAFISNSSEGIWRLEFDPPIDITLPVDEQVELTYRNGRFSECNEAMARMYGLERIEDLVGKGLDFMLPFSDPSARAYLASIIDAGYSVSDVESTERDVHGQPRYFANSMSGVVENGRLVRVWGTQRDITNQKLAQDALRESEERFREAAAAARRESEDKAYLAAIVESTDDAIVSKDLDGIVRSCNAAAERLFGYSASELIGQPIRMIIPADRQSEEDEIIAKVRRGVPVDHYQTVRRAKSGRLIDVSLTISPVRDASGRVVGASKIARDITEQKRSASALATQQAWFEITLGSIGDAVIAAGRDGRVTYMNATAEALTRWTAATSAGRRLEEVFRVVDEATGEPVAHLVGRAPLEAATASTGLVLLVSADGASHPVDYTGTPIRDADGLVIGVVVVFRDVTERRRLELERQAATMERERLLEAERAARAEAERASRVKDDFVAMVSHELRTPLNAILGWAQLMSRGRHDDALIERGLNVVMRNTRLQAQLISDLLDISRIVAGKLQLDAQRVELRTIVANAIETLEREAEARGVEIQQLLDDDTDPVAGDSSRLQQVVWNLLANAIKFTPRGGHVRVILRQENTTAEIVVTDDGAGIRADFLPHVFDRFHQADRSITRRFGGLGLGLAIVKHIVDLHGGSVRAESAGEGLGASFTVTLPVVVDAGERHRRAGAGAAAFDVETSPALAGIRVLVVEDEVDTLDFLTRLLQAHGATVLAVGAAADALAVVRDSKPDMLISDIGLPGVDGYELIQQVRRLSAPGRDLPAIALTAYARLEDRTRALRAGYQAHVAKPVEPAELIAMVASFVELTGAQRRSS
jgi:PAS domain S-box-containing protein